MKRFAVLLVFVLVLGLVACEPAAPQEVGGQASTTQVGKGVSATTYEYDDDGSPFTWPSLLGILSILGVVATLLITFRGELRGGYERADVPHKGGLSLAAFFLVLFLISTVFTVVPVTYVAVVRQVFPVTRFYTLGPGTHAVPPIVSTVHLYTTRVRPMKINDIQADCNSVGRPEVFPDVVVWFRLPIREDRQELLLSQNPISDELLLTLDLRYGPKYEETFLLEKAVAAVKEVSGQNTYDYFGSNRAEAQNIVEQTLEEKLEDLVEIQDFTVSFFSYNPDFEARLKDLAQKQIEFEQAEKDVKIAEQRKLEAQNLALKRQEEGEGEKQYKIKIAEGDAEALRLVAEQLKTNPALIPFRWIEKWQGSVPYTFFGGGEQQPSFLFQVPTSSEQEPVAP